MSEPARWLRAVAAMVLTLAAGAARADEPLPTLAQISVTAGLPGPGLWQVRRDGRTLWIVATHSPLPRRMRWRSDDIEALVARADAVVAAPAVRVDAGVGPVGGLFLLPSLLGARRNPEGQTLTDVLPPEVYARWLPLKKKYLGRDRGVERWRPLFAARKLYEEAIEDVGLSEKPVVWPVVERAAKRADVPIVEPVIALGVEAPRERLRELATMSLEDTDCFARTLERLETDLDTMTTRAAAWAVGDIDTLRALPDDDAAKACLDAALQNAVAGRTGFDDLPVRLRAAWIEGAEQALSTHATSVAVLPLSAVLADGGVLDDLAVLGYEVIAPE